MKIQYSNGEIVEIEKSEDLALKTMRHTCSHLMAQAVKRLFPEAKLGVGPAIENGFYYDFDNVELKQEDLEKIEAEMKVIEKENLKIESFSLSVKEATELMKNEPYKQELINEISESEEITFFKQGEFTDLCAGPHLMYTSAIGKYKLLNVTGAYWKGSEKNKMMQRIYALCFFTREELDKAIEAKEEAKRRDHNKIGRELEFFTTVDYIGQGLPILLPKGAKTVQLLQRFVEDEEEKRGYLLTKTPFMAKNDLYKISGHWDHYRDGMFILGDENKDDEVFALRPMTCPFQFQVFLNKQRSYRDLPMRLAETSTLFRNESSGEMHGLIRVRQFTISEGHIICMPEQLEQEFKQCLELANYMLKVLGLSGDISYRFSKWDEDNKDKYIGDAKEWEDVQDKMEEILKNLDLNYTVGVGEAAFYGPKLDIQIKNVHGKEDTLITVQIDFQLAQKFNMQYVDSDGQKKYPYIIHRTSIGCYERTLALLIEKYAGALPVMFAPIQAKILPISDNQLEYANIVKQKLEQQGIRVEIDERNEKIGYKIREAQLEKIPYMLVIGEKEKEEGKIGLRSRIAGDVGVVSLEEFIKMINKEIGDIKNQ